MLNISQVILMRTDSNLCRKELTVHWSAPNSLIRSFLQPCTNSMWGDESEAVAPIIWLYQIVDAQKEEVSFPELLITLRGYDVYFNYNLHLRSTRHRRHLVHEIWYGVIKSSANRKTLVNTCLTLYCGQQIGSKGHGCGSYNARCNYLYFTLQYINYRTYIPHDWYNQRITSLHCPYPCPRSPWSAGAVFTQFWLWQSGDESLCIFLC